MDRRLRRAVLERLAAVEQTAVQTGSQLSEELTRNHLRTTTGGWRKLLIEHQPDDKGRCPVCSGWLRRRHWPCQVWATAHQQLVGGGPEPFVRPDRRAGRSRQPRRVEVIPRQVNASAAADRTSSVDRNHASPAGKTAARTVPPRGTRPPITTPVTDGVSISHSAAERRPASPRSARSRFLA